MPRMIDQFGRKRCQKKRTDLENKLLQEFFQKYFVVNGQCSQLQAIKNSVSTYVLRSLYRGRFILVESVKLCEWLESISHFF